MAEFLTPVNQMEYKVQTEDQKGNKIRCKEFLTEGPDIVASTAQVKRLADIDLTLNVSSSFNL